MKKYLSLIAVLALLVACMIPVSAAETAEAIIESKSVELGEGTVLVELNVSTGSVPYAGGDFRGLSVTGDAEIKEVKGVSVSGYYNPDGGIYGFINTTNIEGTLFTIVVEVPVSKPATFTVNFTSGEASNAALDDYAVTFTAGTITVKHDCVAGEAVKENEVAPTCEKAGGYDLVVYCTLCGKEMSREHVEVAALGHAWDEGVLPETYDCDDVLKTYTCERCDATKTEDASHKHAIATYTLDRWFAEDGSQWVKQQEKCEHGVEGKDGYHGCSYEGEIKEVQVEGPITGDITPYIAMGVLTLVALVSAAAYMLLKRKAI